jgi:enoyl-CoA hydratase/carnithine racemase
MPGMTETRPPEPAPRRVSVERDGHVLLVGVDRADKRNAWDLATIDQVAAAYEELGDDPELRVGVLFGHGAHFSAGLQLDTVWPSVVAGGPGALAGGRAYDPFGVWGPPVPKPVVLAVQGIAYTLAIELALAADVVVAADDVRFAQLEIARGFVPFGGATFKAPARLGWGNAMRFLLTAEEFGAAEALRIGLVQEVVPAGQQLDRARAIAHTVAAQAPLAVAATLANARLAEREGVAAAPRHLAEVLPRLAASADAAEGVASFVERRQARFTGR